MRTCFVATLVAGFAAAESVDTGSKMAGFASLESVDTSSEMAGFRYEECFVASPRPLYPR